MTFSNYPRNSYDLPDDLESPISQCRAPGRKRPAHDRPVIGQSCRSILFNDPPAMGVKQSSDVSTKGGAIHIAAAFN